MSSHAVIVDTLFGWFQAQDNLSDRDDQTWKS